MNKLRLILPSLGLLTGLLWAAQPAKAPVAESALIQQRIDTLLKRRLKPEALPVDAPNPFSQAAGSAAQAAPARDPLVPATAPLVPGPTPAVVNRVDEEAGAASTTELLARVATRLRITGVIRLKDQLHIIINDNPWKESDYLVLNQGGRILRLQVLRIQPGQLTLRLEDAELVLKF